MDRIQQEIETPADNVIEIEAVKIKHLNLKDELYGMIKS